MPRISLLLTTALLCVWAPMALAQENQLYLGVGIQKPLSISGVSKVSVADPSVADVKAVGGQILVTGLAEGKTTLIIWKSSGQRISYLVTVRKQDITASIKEIQALLGDIEGVSVRQVGDRIFLDGSVYTTQDAERVEQVVALYPNSKNFVRVTPNATRLMAQTLNGAFQKAGLKNVQANVVSSSIFLEGSVESQQDLQKAELVTKAMGAKAENLVTVGIKRMILAEVQFVEIRRTITDRYGIKYPTDISGTVTGTGVLGKDILPAGPLGLNLGARLNGQASFAIGFQNNDGYGRLLAQPRLVCASGEKAEFLAGGQIPIPLITQNQFTVEYKDYGVILKLRPTADRNGNISTDIEAEVSQVDPSVSVSVGGSSTVPGFLVRRVKTSVSVRHGETIVLSNVFNADENKAVSKLPGLGHIPIIGELFKNRAFDTNKRELVIFVTPRIVNPDSDKIRTLIEDMKARYKQARNEVYFNIFD